MRNFFSIPSHGKTTGGGSSRNFGFTMIEVLISLAIIAYAAKISMSSFTNAKEANIRVMGQLNEGLMMQRVLDFLYDPQLCKYTNISLDGIPYVYKGQWATFADLKSIRIGSSAAPELSEPLIEVKDYGALAVKRIKLTNVFPAFSQPSNMTNMRYALGSIVIDFTLKNSTIVKQFDSEFFFRIDAANKIVDCRVFTSEQQICEDLGWIFDREGHPSCRPT